MPIANATPKEALSLFPYCMWDMRSSRGGPLRESEEKLRPRAETKALAERLMAKAIGCTIHEFDDRQGEATWMLMGEDTDGEPWCLTVESNITLKAARKLKRSKASEPEWGSEGPWPLDPKGADENVDRWIRTYPEATMVIGPQVSTPRPGARVVAYSVAVRGAPRRAGLAILHRTNGTAELMLMGYDLRVEALIADHIARSCAGEGRP